MTGSSDFRASSENVAPNTSAVVDWVHNQSNDDSPYNFTTSTQGDQTVNLRPRPISSRKPLNNQRRSLRPAKIVYSIDTLLKLREEKSAAPVMLRVKPEAIAENIFQYMGANSTHRLPNRSRGLSDMSSFSRSSSDFNSRGACPGARLTSAAQTIRQPFGPPETSTLQRNDGFVRFLKQHASPPHHRVTAGGRIVPTGPSSPPPMFDFASLNGLVRKHPAAAKSGQNDGNATAPLNMMQSPTTPSITLGGYLATQGDSMVGQQLSSANPTQPATSFNVAPGPQQFVAPMVQAPSTIVPLAVFPDGSTLVSFNSNNYRTYWNGLNLIMEPFRVTPSPTGQRSYSGGYLQAPYNDPNSGFATQAAQTPAPSVPFANTTNGSRADAQKPNTAFQNRGMSLETYLRTQLTDLDKYLALHHFDIAPTERASLVSQRMHLVEEIDKIRVSKEQTKHPIPIIQPAAGASAKPAAPLAPQVLDAPRYRSDMRDATAKLGPVKDKMGAKCLSPAALPFVPKSMQNTRPVSMGDLADEGSMQETEQAKEPELQAGQKSALNIMDIASTAISRKGKALHVEPPNLRNHLHSDESTSSVLDPSDPAMRVVEYEDIEYAARYLYNWDQSNKVYCTTVEEFQEAVRRVREQARMYGCAGGSSKDPAYDAEQDLWWAICDRDPIPLPTKVPDHVSNPRPWNWNESAFNYRHQGAPAPGPGCERARDSPRLSGWDPAVTDTIKDTMDISRSYNSLKEQLPLAPFREYDCGPCGTEVQIQAQATDPGAKFRGPLCQLNEDQPSIGDENGSVPSAPTANLEVVCDLTTSDLNQQHVARIRTSRAKPDGMSNLTEGLPVKPEPSLSEYEPSGLRLSAFPPKDIVPKEPLSSTIITRGTEAGSIQLPTHAYQPYAEDYPGTPGAGRLPAGSKESPTPQNHTRSASSKVNNSNGMVGEPSVWDYPHPFQKTNAYGKALDINDPWYGAPTDPITLEYLARLKAWRPGDPDVLETMQAQADVHGKNDSDATQNLGFGLKGENMGYTSNLASYEHEDFMGFSAQTKSPWGPEEDGNPSKVNIPIETRGRQTLDEDEVTSIKIPTQTTKDCHQFLRKMLKSPPYTAAQAFKQISAALNEKMSRISNSEAKMKRIGHKASLISNEHSSFAGTFSSPDAASNPTSPFKSHPNVAISKAPSSLASSGFQAHGFLPHLQSAGRAQTTSFGHKRVYQPPQSLARVNLPRHDTLDRKQTRFAPSSYRSYGNGSDFNISALNSTPVNFGFDGGAESPASDAAKPSTSNQHTNPNFDYKGVTTADYETKRPAHDNEWHRGAVEDLFNELRHEEQEKMQEHQEVPSKRAA